MKARQSPKLMALRVAGSYALVGTAYILLSDRLLTTLAGDYHDYQLLQTYKGWAFIALTSIVLWIVLSSIWTRLSRTFSAVLLAEDRLRMALTAAGGAVWSAQPKEDGEVEVTIVGGLAESLGLEVDRPSSSSDLRNRVHPDDLAEFDGRLAQVALRDASILDLICRVKVAGGTYRWVKIVPDVSSVARSPTGALSGVAFDVSDLQETARSLSEVIAGGELGTWRLDLRTGLNEINDRWAELIGYKREELEPVTVSLWRSLVHPEDIARVEAIHAQRLLAEQYFFVDEFRMRHKDGRWVWILSRGRAVEISDTGAAMVMVGVHVDIARRKALEDELLAERDFLLRLTETSISGILALNERGEVIFANREAESILGASAAQMIGRMHDDPDWNAVAIDGSDLAEADFPFSQVIRTGSVVRDIRLRFRHPNGSERVISVNAAPTADKKGVVHVVCSVTDITERLNDEQKIAKGAEEAQYAALHDYMTGLPNRELFEDYLEHAIRRADHDGTLLMQVFIDIDNSKLVNDRFGHQFGDRLICRVAGRLDLLRGGADVLARVAGDEFTLLYSIDTEASVPNLMRELSAAFDGPFELEGNSIYLTASIGISIYPIDASTSEETWLNADIAMYEAKTSGRNQYVQFSSKIRERLAREAKVVQSLQHALRERQFALVLQPKVYLSDPTKVFGAEALIRCLNPELLGIGPAEFMPVAEKTGLVRHIDLLMVGLIGKFVAGLRRSSMSLRISVNLSPESLRLAGFGPTLLASISQAGLTNSDILFELTEGAIMDMSTAVRENVDLLLAHDFELSADDFGTGYSSLSNLQQLRLKELKIDRSFVMRLGLSDGASDPIVRAILAMADALDLRTVAEGIETKEQMDWLTAHGCTIGQGYYFGKGIDPKAFVERFLVGR
ncbi:EAL domain-containing protein [Rhodobacter sp. Har01]|uniref:EAL domain-containing protein n=1 Tax=Rhodobacter sp. Har01 TaxID=2883999 RepID=UPI001D087167|nr:EAL domain-containing protein [Rhodobacter sp. Har01]MCB6177622.1 EAL domain-containing protein [Rhodobacter sp. Har01]